MKQLFILCVSIILSGCAVHVEPVTTQFPQVPDILMEKCIGLNAAVDGMSLSEYTKVITSNYVLYHECSRKVQGWHEWYSKQKEIALAKDK